MWSVNKKGSGMQQLHTERGTEEWDRLRHMWINSNRPRYGSFSGNPKTEWLSTTVCGDLEMRLLEDFWYDDPDGKRWSAEAGSIIHGGCIPRPIWSTLGNPFTDQYRRAAIVHEAVRAKTVEEQRLVDRMFYFACLASGCSREQSKALYAGVRVGTWARRAFSCEMLSGCNLLFRITEQPQIAEIKVSLTFAEVARELQKLGHCAEFEVVEAVVDRFL